MVPLLPFYIAEIKKEFSFPASVHKVIVLLEADFGQTQLKNSFNIAGKY